jgi:MYXO-CTERM domain-containing protein
MLNFAVVSVTAVGASIFSLTSAAPSAHSESGSLVIFGLGLLVLAAAARRSRDAGSGDTERER